MAIKVTLFILFILGILIFAGLAGWKAYQRYDDEDEHGIIAPIVFGILAVVMLVGTICIPGNIHQVNTGEVAVVRHMGKVTGSREAGIYWDWYFTNDYEKFDTKVREINIDTPTYSKDNQIITVQADLQYTIDSAQVDKIATEYGTIDKLESKITNIALDNIKAVFAQNSATEVITNRADISANISQTVSNSINDSYYVKVKTIVLTNIDFTDDFEAAVAAKVAAAQEAEKAKNEAEKAKTEAEAAKEVAILKAQAEAEAVKAQARAAAEAAVTKAEAEQKVAQIEADTAEYAGQKAAAVAIQKLASVNGWSVQTSYVKIEGSETPVLDEEGNQVVIDGEKIYTYKYNTQYKLVDADGQPISQADLTKGVERLIEVYKLEAWDGKLPVYQMGENGIIAFTQSTSNNGD